MKQPYRHMSFKMLSDYPKVASLNDMLMLNDNFNNPIHMDRHLLQDARASYDKLTDSFCYLVCLEGHIDFMTGMKDLRLEKGDAIINSNGNIGGFYGMSDDCKFLLIIVDSNFYIPYFTSTDGSDLQSIIARHPICHLDGNGIKAVLSTFELLKSILNQEPRPIYIKETALGLIQTFAFIINSQLVAEANRGHKNRKSGRAADIYQSFLEAVKENFMHERDITFYADKLCLTPKYLSQVIYKESGNYAGEHIRKYVITEAKALIKSRQYTMSQICDMLNFSSQSFFTKYFKNATGLSPSEYKNS